MIFKIYTDGSANLSKGISGNGWVIYQNETKLLSGKNPSSQGLTNNEEEYNGIIDALETIEDLNFSISPEKIIIKSDSELVVKQLTGIYKIRKSHLKPLAEKIKQLIKLINIPVEIVHIPREQNTEADALAREALKIASSLE